MQCSPLFCELGLCLHRLQRLVALVVTLVGIVFVSTPSGVRAAEVYQACHLYLYQAQGNPVDVTSTLYTSGGESYVVLNGNPIQILPNYQTGHIFDAVYGNCIGFYYLPGS